jgi:hypothetical protein
MTSQPAFWIAIAMLAPFGWGVGLLLLALLSRIVPTLRARLDGLFQRLDATPIPR